MSGDGGEASAYRFPLSPVFLPCHLLLAPLGSEVSGFTTDIGGRMAKNIRTSAPPETKTDTNKRLAGAVAALLDVIHLLSDESQGGALLDCSSMADDLARDLDAFVGALA